MEKGIVELSWETIEKGEILGERYWWAESILSIRFSDSVSTENKNRIGNGRISNDKYLSFHF